MTSDEKRAICDILKYIQKQPQVKHTAEGIARNWIFQQRLEEKVEIVLAAIKYLVMKDFLEEIKIPGGISYYKVNKEKIIDIPAVLSRLKKN